MGNNLFGANISGRLARSLGSRLPRGTLVKDTIGARDPNNLASGQARTPVNHRFRGIRMGLSALRKESILPDARDAVLILGDTISPSAIPVTGDRVIVEATTLTIVNVSRDPDAATYTCQVK